MFVWFSPGSESLTVTGVLESNGSSDAPGYLYVSASSYFTSSWKWTWGIFDIPLSLFLSYFLHRVLLPMFPSKIMPLNSCCMCMSVCVCDSMCPTSPPPQMREPVGQFIWQKNTDLKVKFLWGWKREADGYTREPVCPRSIKVLPAQLTSPFIRHQRTPTGVCPWKSDFILSVSHGLLVRTGGFGTDRTETGRLGWKTGVSLLFCTFEIYDCLPQVIRSP